MQVPQISCVEFLDLLEKSKLLTDERLAEIRRLAPTEPAPALEFARTLVQQGDLTRYQAEELLSGKPRGFFVANFRKLELLGAGGMSFLFLAAEPTAGKRVAIKVVTEKYRDDAGMLTRLRLEAAAGQKIKHPNVVRTHGLQRFDDVYGDNHLLVMDFIEGVNLEELLQLKKVLDWQQACDYARQAALGLAAGHAVGVIHRDVKPANLLVDRQGKIRLLDFGLALLSSKVGKDDDEYSLAMLFGHDCLGTADFIAPEQSRNSIGVDERADIYSLGCTFYTILCGQVPFPAVSAREKIEGHRHGTAVPISQRVPHLPRGVAELVSRMMAREVENRPATMLEVAESLAEFSVVNPVEFDFPRVLAYRASQARQRLKALAQAGSGRFSSGGSSRALSHWGTTATQKLPHVAGDSATKNSVPPVDSHSSSPVLSPDIAFGAAVSTTPTTTADCPVLKPVKQGPVIYLKSSRIVVGRNPECDCVIADTTISGRHCELRFSNASWVIRDLGSKNGVQVNDRLLTGAGSEYPIASGDRITIGKLYVYDFEIPTIAITTPSPTSHSRPWVLITLIVLAVLALAGWALLGNR